MLDMYGVTEYHVSTTSRSVAFGSIRLLHFISHAHHMRLMNILGCLMTDQKGADPTPADPDQSRVGFTSSHDDGRC